MGGVETAVSVASSLRNHPANYRDGIGEGSSFQQVRCSLFRMIGWAICRGLNVWTVSGACNMRPRQ